MRDMNLRYRPSPTLHLAACQSYSRFAGGRKVCRYSYLGPSPLPARAQARARRRGDLHVGIPTVCSFGPCPRSNPQRGRDKRDPRINKTQENHPTFLCYCFHCCQQNLSSTSPKTTLLPRIAATRKKAQRPPAPSPIPPIMPTVVHLRAETKPLERRSPCSFIPPPCPNP